MASQPSGLLILDANVLIDYCATGSDAIQHVSAMTSSRNFAIRSLFAEKAGELLLTDIREPRKHLSACLLLVLEFPSERGICPIAQTGAARLWHREHGRLKATRRRRAVFGIPLIRQSHDVVSSGSWSSSCQSKDADLQGSSPQ